MQFQLMVLKNYLNNREINLWIKNSNQSTKKSKGIPYSFEKFNNILKESIFKYLVSVIYFTSEVQSEWPLLKLVNYVKYFTSQ